MLTRFQFLAGQDKRRFVGLAIAQETTLRRGIVAPVGSCVIPRGEVVHLGLLAIEVAAAAIAASDAPHPSKERRLLPEVGSLLAAKEHIEAVGMPGAVMTREALDAHAQEHAPDLGRHSVNPVQT